MKINASLIRSWNHLKKYWMKMVNFIFKILIVIKKKLQNTKVAYI